MNKLLSTTQAEPKLLFVGGVDAGKTTALNAICQNVVGCQAQDSGKHKQRSMTTVAMEYGIVYMDGQKIHLYGSPGQRRFDFMLNILRIGASAMMIIINDRQEQKLEELDYHLSQHRDYLLRHPGLIAINHSDNETRLSVYQQHCLKRGLDLPVISMDARSQSDVEKTLRQLLVAVYQQSPHTMPLSQVA